MFVKLPLGKLYCIAMSSTCLVLGIATIVGTADILDHWTSPDLCLWRISFGKSYAKHFLHRLVRDGVRLGAAGVLRSDLDPNLCLHFGLHPQSWLVHPRRTGLQMVLCPLQKEYCSTWKCLQTRQFNWQRTESGWTSNWKQVSISPTFYKQLLHLQSPKAQKRQSIQAVFCAFGICMV